MKIKILKDVKVVRDGQIHVQPLQAGEIYEDSYLGESLITQLNILRAIEEEKVLEKNYEKKIIHPTREKKKKFKEKK